MTEQTYISDEGSVAMPAIAIIAIVLGSVLYLVLGVMTGVKVDLFLREKYCRMPYHDATCGHIWVSMPSGLIWPVAWPVVLGVQLATGDLQEEIQDRRLSHKQAIHARQEENRRHELAMAQLEEDRLRARERAAGIHREL